MKKFRFSLQAVLTVRQRQEQTALEHFSKAVAARQLATDRLSEAKRECQAAWALSRERTAAGAPAVHLAQLHDYCHDLEKLQKECERVVAAAQVVVDQKWEKLVTARQAREAVDKFLERQRERYDRELQREEQKMFDDVSRQHAFASTNWKATLQGSLN
jgi:flagellar export protein FliJ